MNVLRPSRETLLKLYEIPTTSLSDALDETSIVGFMDCGIKPIIPGKKIVGPAVTIKDVITEKTEAPILALKAIDSAQKGDVIVRSIEDAAEATSKNIGLWGGLMATASKHKGIEGAVLDGGVRDVSEVRTIQFQIFAQSVVPSTSVRRTKVEAINVPITCGGRRVNPGDVIAGDEDGVVIIPQKYLSQIIKRASEMDKIESLEMEELKRGTSFIETINKFSRI